MSTAAIRDLHRPKRIALRGGGELRLRDRPLIMGVLNITPDSFSDGGFWLHPEKAIEWAEKMVSQGAEILDLGAESTRPGGGVYGQGAVEVSADEELRRLLPVIESLRSRVQVPISVDTRKSQVAEAALAAGADLVNDISALADPEMAAIVRQAECSVVLMHSRGSLRDMQRRIHFDDVVADVVAELDEIVGNAIDRGLEHSRLIVDPGIGFGKRTSDNLELLKHLDALQTLDLPILVGASRKSFIGDIAAVDAHGRLPGSLAAVGWAARNRAAIVRVHDVAETAQFLDLWEAIERADSSPVEVES